MVDLNGHDWISSTGEGGVPWNQKLIRSKVKASKAFDGHWATRFVETRDYTFKLSRWPLYIEQPIRASLPA